MKKRFLIMLAILLSVGVLCFESPLATALSPSPILNTYKNNPEFWSDWSKPTWWSPGLYQYLGKKYAFADNSGVNWVTSAPKLNDYGDRKIEYWKVPNNGPRTLTEYEIWRGNFNTSTSTVYQYGGQLHFSNTSKCASGQPGVNNPVDFVGTPEEDVWKVDDVAAGIMWDPCNEGYIATKITDLWHPSERETMCNQYFPTTSPNYELTRRICNDAPSAGLVEQRYVFPSDYFEQPTIGCEMIVYVWGYPTPSNIGAHTSQEAKWMSNGEMRLAGYDGKSWAWTEEDGTPKNGIPAYDDLWWEQDVDRWKDDGVPWHTGTPCNVHRVQDPNYPLDPDKYTVKSVWDWHERNKYYTGEYRLQDQIHSWDWVNAHNIVSRNCENWMEGCP